MDQRAHKPGQTDIETRHARLPRRGTYFQPSSQRAVAEAVLRGRPNQGFGQIASSTPRPQPPRVTPTSCPEVGCNRLAGSYRLEEAYNYYNY